MRKLVLLSRKYPGRISANAGALAEWNMFKQMEHARKTGVMSKQFKMGKLSACGCMLVKLAVHHDGTIAPCNMLGHSSLGKITENSISTIWKTHPLLEKMRRRRDVSMLDVPGCEDCQWAPYCNGGCPSTEFTEKGDLMVTNAQSCYRKFISETGGLPEISEIGQND